MLVLSLGVHSNHDFGWKKPYQPTMKVWLFRHNRLSLESSKIHKTMIVPWQQIEPTTLENLIREFVLQEGTDYGDNEIPFSEQDFANPKAVTIWRCSGGIFRIA